jgi:hypothetical protein
MQYICSVTLNRIKQILLLATAVFSISLTAFFSVGLFHAHKLATSSSIVTNETEKLIVSFTEFSSLPKNILNNNVFEIEYHGEEYDVYKKEFIKSKSQVILWLIKDGFENKIRKLNSIVFNINSFKNKCATTEFVIFNFYFFENANNIFFNEHCIYTSNHFTYNSNSCIAFIENVNPPPKQA